VNPSSSNYSKPTVEHLTKDGMCWSGEVQIERVVGLLSALPCQKRETTHLSKVVKLKDEFLGEVVDPSPNDPSDTDGTYHQNRSEPPP
jgi:hypothetical protein